MNFNKFFFFNNFHEKIFYNTHCKYFIYPTSMIFNFFFFPQINLKIYFYNNEFLKVTKFYKYYEIVYA